jgi:hypothetical protein
MKMGKFYTREKRIRMIMKFGGTTQYKAARLNKDARACYRKSRT